MCFIITMRHSNVNRNSTVIDAYKIRKLRIKEAGLVIKRRNFVKIKLAMCEQHAIIPLIDLIASISTSFNVISIRKC